MTAGIWLSLALAALIGEFLSGTFYLLIVSLAFGVTALATFLGADLALQLVVASLSAVSGVVLLRRYRKRISPKIQAQVNDPDLGQRVEVRHIGTDRQARVQYRGTTWDAELLDPSLVEGQHAYIVGRDGNRLIVDTTQTEESA